MMKHLAHPAWRVGAETKLTEHVRKILAIFPERFWKGGSWSQCFQLGSYSSFSCY